MIKSELKKVRNLLDESIEYVVPPYQRNFAWKRSQAEEFLNDISSDSIFLGTIVLDTSREVEGQISIVDGQQRITTIFILLAACRRQAKKINSIGQAQEIQRKISFIDDTSGRSNLSKLKPSPSIATIFEKTIASEEWDGRDFDFKSKKREANRIRPIYEFFSEKIAKMDKDELAGLLKKVYESTVIKIEVQETQEAFEIFERTNARGTDLDAADLLKNYLFKNSASENLTEDWDTIVGNASGNILRLIKYYYVSNFGGVQKKFLFKEMERHGDAVGPDQLLSRIKDFAYYYNLIISGNVENISEWSAETNNDFFRKEYNAESLHRVFEALRLFGVSQGYPLITKLFLVLDGESDHEKKKKISEKLLVFLKTVEKFHFLNYAVGQRPGNQIEGYYADKCKIPISSANMIDFLKQITKELRDEKIIGEAEFSEKFSELSYVNDPTLIYYIYDRLNNQDRTGGQYISIYNPDKKLLRKNYDIDHLISQDATNYDFTEEEIADYIDSIGNLLVISKHTNGSMQNMNIVEKLRVLKKLESQNLPEAELLVAEWGSKQWTPVEKVIESIKERSRSVAKRAYGICWKI
ncbi:MAG: DUF262 domain-containing protein [Candidatus Paceibacteria bacterium]